MLFALVDCNNFYASCERVFRPDLEGRPVIVLSNNDGCVIARSAEAKSLGIKMGIPAFEIETLIEQEKVVVFSSNYALYGDMSQRVMNVLSQMSPDIEIYSIDEAFLRIDLIRQLSAADYAQKIRTNLLQWLGIPVSVGIGPTKTLAKAANHLAKSPVTPAGVFCLTGTATDDPFLRDLPAGKIWGIGEQHALFLQRHGIHTACDLKYASESWIRASLHVNGARIVKELNGVSCLPLDESPAQRKAVCVSRSYGRPTRLYEEVEQATAAFVATMAGKLRKRQLLASRLTVFVMTNRFARGPRYVNFRTLQLPVPTQDTSELNRYMVRALKTLFREGYLYKKSGVLAEELIPEHSQQMALWDLPDRERQDRLMKALDLINAKTGKDRVRFALQGFDRKWKMRQEKLSASYTTKWTDILNIQI